METEKYIDEFIKREQQTEPNPFLSTRVMAAIEENRQSVNRKPSLWQIAVVTGSLTAVAFLGISIGNSYVSKAEPATILNINDSQIEKLSYYNLDDYE